ncbi:hypothetical protein HPB48_010553 [Haemaphysalis longicornis]|uniref:Uncharacterized protein n=1 Tax=Haemaphysalis longicornis TaxID=44386 RepID=A0A9J6GT88_HAELO|nr:hypothetical protein HPB48_010553 [Haemaphysalis longicornis]
MPYQATVTHSENLPPKSPGSSASDAAQSLQEDDDCPPLVVRINNKLGAPNPYTHRHRGPPRALPFHTTTSTHLKTAPRTANTPSMTDSWQRPDSSAHSNDRANKGKDCLPSGTTRRHQNNWKSPFRSSCSSSGTKLPTSSPNPSRASRQQGDAIPALHDHRYRSQAAASPKLTEPPSSKKTSGGSNGQTGTDSPQGIPVLCSGMTADQRHRSWASSLPSKTEAYASSRYQDEGSDDDAPVMVCDTTTDLVPFPEWWRSAGKALGPHGPPAWWR